VILREVGAVSFSLGPRGGCHIAMHLRCGHIQRRPASDWKGGRVHCRVCAALPSIARADRARHSR